jgi:hypothetical protein
MICITSFPYENYEAHSSLSLYTVIRQQAKVVVDLWLLSLIHQMAGSSHQHSQHMDRDGASLPPLMDMLLLTRMAVITSI